MLALITAALLQVSAPQPATLALTSSTANALVDSLEAAELRFFREWRDIFTKVNDPGAPTQSNLDARALRNLRESLAHCHPDSDGRDGFLPVPGSRIIASGPSRYGACPSWTLSTPIPFDESIDHDAAVGSVRDAVRASRASLIALFDAAARAAPGNDWIAGQRVRLLVDQGEFALAESAARACRARSVSLCGMLLGYVIGAHGDLPRADSVFTATLGAMPLAERCAWSDVRTLFDGAARRSYEHASCAERDSVSRIVWWLADPLYIVPRNERRAEHYVRVVLARLRAAAERDERFDWNDETGGDALREMVIRYGWPSYLYYGGPGLDGSHSGYLGVHGSPRHEPYTTFEYTPGRIHLVPEFHAIADPPHAASTDWTITEQHADAKANGYAVDRVSSAIRRMNTRLNAWWPAELFVPALPLAQLPDGMHAFFRRDTTAILATAADLVASELGRPDSSEVRARFIMSPRPDSMRVMATVTAKIGSTLAMRAELGREFGVAGIEVDPTSTLPGARTRFGVAPPPTLAWLDRGEIAISDVALLKVPRADRELPTDPDVLLPAMLGSSTLGKGDRFAIYWETYGIAPYDSTEFAVWIERVTPQGILRRFGIRLSVATDLNTPVSHSWMEFGPNTRRTVIPGRVPIVGRSLLLDASHLPPGDYWLDVVVRKAGAGEPVRARQKFTVAAK
ncbi:MAG TPA: hypothetical protein VE967_12950 [Gemmatimonadaceae bacterium]|nr:hypothetical protein [Gemmatimonadaceae bacterium]